MNDIREQLDPTRIHDIDRAHRAAIAEYANRTARLQPVIPGNYDEPFTEVGGLQAFVYADADWTLHVDVCTADVIDGPFARTDGTEALAVKVDGTRVHDTTGAGTVEVDGEAKRIAGEQGWSNEALGGLAYAFLAYAANDATRREFLAYLREAQRQENDKLTHLSTDQLATIARRVFNVLEFGDPDGHGERGQEWKPDTLQEIDAVFHAHGVGFTSPDEAAEMERLLAENATT